MRRAAVVLAGLLTTLGAAAPAALADHVHPTVTATLELGGKVKDCDSRQVCGGSRRATVNWNASCGPGIPDSALEEIDVSIRGIRPSGRRFDYDGETFDSEGAGLVDSLAMTAGPGLRFLGQVKVTCSVQTLDENEHLVDHRASATATTGELSLPPRLAG